MTTTTTFNIQAEPTKEQLVEQLYKDGHITFRQALMLMEGGSGCNPQIVPFIQPSNPWDYNVGVTYTTTSSPLHIVKD